MGGRAQLGPIRFTYRNCLPSVILHLRSSITCFDPVAAASDPWHTMCGVRRCSPCYSEPEVCDMTTRFRARPMLEALEERWVPSVSARIVLGDVLRVTGSASSPTRTITITETSPGGFTVSDGATPVFSSGPGRVNNLAIVLRPFGTNRVQIDLGGFTLNGSATATMGILGNNALRVDNGTVNGSLVYNGGIRGDLLTVGAGVTIRGSLVARTSLGNDRVSIGTAARIGQRAVIDLGFDNDRLDINGDIGRGSNQALVVRAGFGDDRVSINAGAIIDGSGTVDMSFGRDVFTLSNLAFLNGSLFVNGGFGFDTYQGTLPRPGVTARSFERVVV